MKAIRIQLDDRRKEFRAYVRMLAHLEARLLHTARLKRVGDLPTNETFKSMKATAFLMLYNVIESTVVGVMTELYKVIEQEGCKLPDVSVKLQDLWIDQRFRMPRDATSATYRKRVAEMLRETMDGKNLSLIQSNFASVAISTAMHCVIYAISMGVIYSCINAHAEARN